MITDYTNDGEVRVYATDMIHVVIDPPLADDSKALRTFTIQDTDKEETESNQVIMWAKDIHSLIAALEEAKTHLERR